MTLPDSMLAARCLEYRSSPPLNLVRLPIPKPGAKEVLVRVLAASLCHTDVAMCLGDKINEGNTIPQTAGHEPVGSIVAMGSEVEGLQVGDRVGFVNHAGSCGLCEECLQGQNTYCLDPRTKLRGVNMDGCFSEYALGDAVYTFKVPDKLSNAEAAPLMCAGVTAYAAVKSANLLSGQWLAVFGCGGLGHLAIQFAKALGFKTVAFDIRETSLALAKKLGADLTVNVADPEGVKELIKITGGGVHASMILAESQDAMNLSAHVTRKHGSICLVAAPKLAWEVSPLWVIHKDLRFTGSLLSTPQQCRDMIDLVEHNDIHVETKLYPFAEVNQMIADARAGKTDGRLVLTF